MQELLKYNKAIVAIVVGFIATVVAMVTGVDPDQIPEIQTGISNIPGVVQGITTVVTGILVWAIPNGK